MTTANEIMAEARGRAVRCSRMRNGRDLAGAFPACQPQHAASDSAIAGGFGGI
jgi:hypothetical protein